MKIYLILCLVLCLLACTTLQKESTKNKTSNASLVAQNKQHVASSTLVKTVSDSSEVDEEVLFWPKGIVKYSAANGFEGEVTKISWRKKAQRKFLLRETNEATAITNKNILVKQEEKKLIKQEVKESKNFKFLSLILIGFVFLAMVVYLFYRRKWIWPF